MVGGHRFLIQYPINKGIQSGAPARLIFSFLSKMPFLTPSKHNKQDKNIFNIVQPVSSTLWQVSTLQDLKTFLANPENNPKGITFKTQADRRKHIKEKMNLKIVKHPSTGVECVPVHDRTIMLSGHRTSASRVKEEEHSSREEAREAHARAQSSVQVQRNTRVMDLVVDGVQHVWESFVGPTQYSSKKLGDDFIISTLEEDEFTLMCLRE